MAFTRTRVPLAQPKRRHPDSWQEEFAARGYETLAVISAFPLDFAALASRGGVRDL